VVEEVAVQLLLPLKDVHSCVVEADVVELYWEMVRKDVIRLAMQAMRSLMVSLRERVE
jgi:hypothetical protein